MRAGIGDAAVVADMSLEQVLLWNLYLDAEDEAVYLDKRARDEED